LSIGIPFVGMLFTGIMLTKSGPKALEYNARFGDPETQTLLPLLNGDLGEIMVACVEGRLHEVKIEMFDKSSAVVVISAGGYPGNYRKGERIEIDPKKVVDSPSTLNLFHAGTKLLDDGSTITAGGRVMAVSATGETLEEAVKSAYEGVAAVHFDGMFYRKDIAHRYVLLPISR
jgi:phosphoribosylamine--glycine ligase / phosphoribosylformylglycinamidine cyclo-ligase